MAGCMSSERASLSVLSTSHPEGTSIEAIGTPDSRMALSTASKGCLTSPLKPNPNISNQTRCYLRVPTKDGINDEIIFGIRTCR